MTYLFLAIVCSTSIALIFKVSETRRMERLTVTAFNYLVATLVSAVMLYMEGTRLPCLGDAAGALFHQLPSVLGRGGVFDLEGSAGWALLLGIPSGVLYFLGFMYLQKAVNSSGVSLAGSFSKMGVLVPMILAIFLWKEVPEPVQWAGILLALLAILLANLDLSGLRNALRGFQPVLIALFVTVGLSEFSNKVYQKYGVLEMKGLFLFFVFAAALVISLFILLGKRKKVRPLHVLTGLLVGIPNYFASFFLILALSRMKTAVVFPVYSAVTIAMISMAGILFFGEKLRKREMVSVALTVVSLVLVNLGT